ncbi:MAG TPA: DbpA RNA binding domain-containing protein, partial [Chloroflexota bacterium]
AYVHRIGRTARAGKAGKAITFVTPRERALLKTIERLIRVNLVRMRVPSLADIAERRAQAFRDSLREILVENHLEPYLVMVEQLGDEFDVSQIAAAAIKLALAEPIDGTEGDDGRSVEQGMERLFVRAGRRDGVSAKDFVGAIANEAGIPGREIGAIDVYDKFSFVEVPKSQARVVVEALSRSGVRGKRVPIDIAVPSQPRK